MVMHAPFLGGVLPMMLRFAQTVCLTHVGARIARPIGFNIRKTHCQRMT